MIIKRYRDIDMFSLQKCLSSIIEYVQKTKGWNSNIFFAKFIALEKYISSDSTKYVVAIFNVTNIEKMEKYLSEIKSQNKKIHPGRFPEEFFLEVNFQDFSIIREY